MNEFEHLPVGGVGADVGPEWRQQRRTGGGRRGGGVGVGGSVQALHAISFTVQRGQICFS